MSAVDYILNKQMNWALNRGISLTGSKRERGRPLYTSKLEDNLHEPLTEETRRQFNSADGGELRSGDGSSVPKMHALHSSSALCVNLFQYWQNQNNAVPAAAACNLCAATNQRKMAVEFEQKFAIDPMFDKHPNIDVVFRVSGTADIPILAVESKFTEPYRAAKHDTGLKEKYLNLPKMWDDLPAIRKLAERISPADKSFAFLHAAQLIKHILGLKRQSGGVNRFRLLYLWYDATGEAGAKHRDEIETFHDVVKKDGVCFYSMTHQELIANVAALHRKAHPSYVRYITDRYL